MPGTFLEILRPARTEAFLAHTRRERMPVEFGIVKAASGFAVVDAAPTEFGLDARGPVAFTDARPDKALYEAVLVKKPVFLQAIQNVADNGRVEVAVGELSLELESGVLAPSQKIHRPAATGLIVLCGIVSQLRPA